MENLDLENKNLIKLFIEEELSLHGEWIVDRMVDEIEKRKLIDTSELEYSLNYGLSHEGDDPTLKLSFMDYGRFIDIHGYKKKELTVSRWEKQVNKDIWGKQTNREKKSKDTRWYAKNMYGGLNRLIGKLIYGISEQELKRLKGILENRKTAE